MDIQIRDAEPTDWAAIAEYNSRLATETEDKTLDWAVICEGVKKVLGDVHKGRYFVAEASGRIIGTTMITYEWSDWRDGWIWWIQSVYVHPDFRGRGVFSALYHHVERLARTSGDVRAIRLYVLTSNDKARRTYMKLGMAETGYTVLEAGDGHGD